MTYITIGDANKQGNQVTFDWYISTDKTPTGVPPKKIIKHQNLKMQFRTMRDAQAFFDIITMAVDHWEIEDKDRDRFPDVMVPEDIYQSGKSFTIDATKNTLREPVAEDQ